MKKDHQDDQLDARALKLSRRARLQNLLFTGAALGTTLLMFAAAEPKLPRYVGE